MDLELRKALALFEDYQDAYAKIIKEECAPDEKHCTCVPALRQEIKRLRKIISVFANPDNWTDDLKWNGKGSPISIAENRVQLPEE